MATTALMPLDPAASPQSISRVLSIRANLLPAEILAGRNARRMRVGVIAALVLVAVLLGAWYAHAVSVKNQADQELDEVSAQVTAVRKGQNQYQSVVTIKTQNETITKQLTTLMAKDLPWATLTDSIRDTGTTAGVTISGITGSVADGTSTTNALPSTSTASTVVILQISGTGPDKKTVAKYVEALGTLADVANPYLSSATQNQAAIAGGPTTITFTLSAEVTTKALCGRFTATCKSGGK
jgi:type IV pilus assembly protein PilN